MRWVRRKLSTRNITTELLSGSKWRANAITELRGGDVCAKLSPTDSYDNLMSIFFFARHHVLPQAVLLIPAVNPTSHTYVSTLGWTSKRSRRRDPLQAPRQLGVEPPALLHLLARPSRWLRSSRALARFFPPLVDHRVDLLPVVLLALALFEEDLVLDTEELLLMYVCGWEDGPARLAHAVHDVPQRFGVAVFVRGSGFGAEHGCAMDNGSVHVLRDQHGHVAGRSHERHENAVLTLGAGHEDRFDLVTGLVHRLDDLVRLQGDELHSGVVVER